MKNRSGEKIKLASIDELLGVVNEESAMEIEISKIHPFKNHPFKVLDDEKMQELVESVKINGVLAFMWEYMKVPENSREKVKNLLKDANENGVKISHQAPTLYDVVPKEEIAEFEELMRKTIADIVSEASSVACWVYVQKYVKHKTLNEMLQELPDVSQFILAMDTWFEKLMVIEAIIEADNEMQRIKDKIGMLHEI